MTDKGQKSKPIVAMNNPINVNVETGKEYRWCSCGRSAAQPYCDDSCAHTPFEPLHFKAKETGEVWLCRCKQSHDAPYCDGHHEQVPTDKVGQEFTLPDYEYKYATRNLSAADKQAAAAKEKAAATKAAAADEDPMTREEHLPEAVPTPIEPTVAYIHKLAQLGLKGMGDYGEMVAMGVPRKDLPDWNDIQIMTAQIAKQPLMEDVAVGTKLVIGPQAKKPLVLDIPLFVSDMSFGSLSQEAKLSLAMGAQRAGTAIASGEGGMLPESQAANKRYMLEYASAKFGYTDELLPKIQAFHFKCGQSAKTGTGGHLPGIKNVGRISEIRKLKPGTNADSPPTFKDLHTVKDFAQMADHVRELTGGIPVGFKMSAQHIEKDMDFAIASGADYIILDGRGGGTGDAPAMFRDHISVPTIPALARARHHLDKQGLSGKITLIITGGLRTHMDFIKAMALGADGIALANSAMQAVGCISARICNTNRCPTGITTQDPELRKRLNVAKGATRLFNFFEVSVHLMQVMARACGHDQLSQFNKDDISSWHKELAELAGIEWSGFDPNR
ncbi:MAG TPA: glutamate synthase-related protein [Flavobacteriales bacterium]|nr:glutamate synthase-related protein [Flavobacteriales bacterium]HRO38322.1 glutamate synthase-related protein [Flavobacteriales bacterium]HRP80431.1 glutamate synthase-related protein [Flavobacteriales bacterium]